MSSLVNGIGGIFFRSKDPKAQALWYQKHLGINLVDGTGTWSQQAGPTVFSPFKADTSYFGSKEQQFMLNFRVSDLVALVKELKAPV